MIVNANKNSRKDHRETANFKSGLLLDSHENLFSGRDADFLEFLGCTEQTRCKVVSIFGGTGDGKSHCLNQAFFKGEHIFRTSTGQTSCTMGVWIAYCSEIDALVLDTEGLLGQTGARQPLIYF